MERIAINQFPKHVQRVFTEDPYTPYYSGELLPSIESKDLKLALETLMLVDKTSKFEPLRKRCIREELHARKRRETNYGQSLMREWDEVTGELRRKFEKGAYWI